MPLLNITIVFLLTSSFMLWATDLPHQQKPSFEDKPDIIADLVEEPYRLRISNMEEEHGIKLFIRTHKYQFQKETVITEWRNLKTKGTLPSFALFLSQSNDIEMQFSAGNRRLDSQKIVELMNDSEEIIRLRSNSINQSIEQFFDEVEKITLFMNSRKAKHTLDKEEQLKINSHRAKFGLRKFFKYGSLSLAILLVIGAIGLIIRHILKNKPYHFPQHEWNTRLGGPVSGGSHITSEKKLTQDESA